MNKQTNKKEAVQGHRRSKFCFFLRELLENGFFIYTSAQWIVACKTQSLNYRKCIFVVAYYDDKSGEKNKQKNNRAWKTKSARERIVRI